VRVGFLVLVVVLEIVILEFGELFGWDFDPFVANQFDHIVWVFVVEGLDVAFFEGTLRDVRGQLSTSLGNCPGEGRDPEAEDPMDREEHGKMVHT